MKFRLKALALHVLSSATVLTLILRNAVFRLVSLAGLVPHRRAARARHSHIGRPLLGPTLTFVIANPSKDGGTSHVTSR